MRAVAEIHLRRGQYERAETHVRRVLELKPESRMGRDALIRLYETMLRDPAYHGDRDQLRHKLAAGDPTPRRVRDSERSSGPAPVGGTTTDRSPATSSPGAIDEATANAIVRVLAAAGRGHPVWFSKANRDAEPDAFYRALRQLFVRAGWVVRREDVVSFAVKPGLFLFAADEQPPAYVTAIDSALTGAGMKVAFNTGYRNYYDEMKRARPTWNGFAMSPEQTFTLVVGPLPSPSGAIFPL